MVKVFQKRYATQYGKLFRGRQGWTNVTLPLIMDEGRRHDKARTKRGFREVMRAVFLPRLKQGTSEEAVKSFFALEKSNTDVQVQLFTQLLEARETINFTEAFKTKHGQKYYPFLLHALLTHCKDLRKRIIDALADGQPEWYATLDEQFGWIGLSYAEMAEHSKRHESKDSRVPVYTAMQAALEEHGQELLAGETWEQFFHRKFEVESLSRNASIFKLLLCGPLAISFDDGIKDSYACTLFSRLHPTTGDAKYLTSFEKVLSINPNEGPSAANGKPTQQAAAPTKEQPQQPQQPQQQEQQQQEQQQQQGKKAGSPTKQAAPEATSTTSSAQPAVSPVVAVRKGKPSGALSPAAAVAAAAASAPANGTAPEADREVYVIDPGSKQGNMEVDEVGSKGIVFPKRRNVNSPGGEASPTGSIMPTKAVTVASPPAAGGAQVSRPAATMVVVKPPSKKQTPSKRAAAETAATPEPEQSAAKRAKADSVGSAQSGTGSSNISSLSKTNVVNLAHKVVGQTPVTVRRVRQQPQHEEQQLKLTSLESRLEKLSSTVLTEASMQKCFEDKASEMQEQIKAEISKTISSEVQRQVANLKAATVSLVKEQFADQLKAMNAALSDATAKVAELEKAATITNRNVVQIDKTQVESNESLKGAASRLVYLEGLSAALKSALESEGWEFKTVAEVEAAASQQ